MILQYDNLKEEEEYLIRYDLYDKEVALTYASLAEDSRGSETNTYCRLPFITQQLLILDKKVAKHRIKSYVPDEGSVDLMSEGL